MKRCLSEERKPEDLEQCSSKSEAIIKAEVFDLSLLGNSHSSLLSLPSGY